MAEQRKKIPDPEIQETVVRERDEIRIDFGPVLEGEVVVVEAAPPENEGHAARPDAREPVGGPPGRDAEPEDLARALADTPLPAEAAEAAARLAAALEGVEDVIDDRQAARFAATPVGPRLAGFPRDVQEIGVRRPELLQAPPQHRDVPALVGGPADGLDRDPPPVPNLPAILGRSVFARDPNFRLTPRPVEPNWHRLARAPGYSVSQIRALGRFIYNTFPCFERQNREIEAAGGDPLAEIRLIANWGQGPNPQAELDVMASWVRANGTIIDVDEIELPVQFPGYRPRIILAADADRSYLLVHEQRAMGCPMDAMYIYTWLGGTAYYLGNRQGLDRLRGMTADALPQPAPRLPAPEPVERIRPARRPAPGRADVPARPAPAVPGAAVAVRDKSARRERLAALPVAEEAKTSTDFLAALGADGFAPFGDAGGPGRRKALPDGGLAVVRGESGRTLANSTSFRLQVFDSAGTLVAEEPVADLSDVSELLSGSSAPAP